MFIIFIKESYLLEGFAGLSGVYYHFYYILHVFLGNAFTFDVISDCDNLMPFSQGQFYLVSWLATTLETHFPLPGKGNFHFISDCDNLLPLTGAVLLSILICNYL